MFDMNYRTIGSLLLILIVIIAGGCSKDQDPIILNPDAGTSFLDIENEGYVVMLNAVAAPEGQVGTWRIYIGENGKFDDVNDPKTNFYGEPGERYVLGWELSEGGEYKSASIDVSFKALNPVLINTPQDTLYNNISLYLEAEAARFGATGEWTIMSGNNARIINAENNEAEFVGTEFEDYTIRWTLSYGSKEVFKEIQFVTDELKAYAGEDNLDVKNSKTAESKFFTLEGFLPAGASAVWHIIKGEQGTVHSNTFDHSLFEGVADTTYALTWTVNLDGQESVDTVNIRFRGKWGMWTDDRDGQSYRFTEVNDLEWMSDNYNYVANPGDGSWYYGQAAQSVIHGGHALETEEDRKFYGRVYDWQTAYDYTPEGWRLPTLAEFNELVTHLGGPLYAGDRIKEGGDTGIDLNFSGYLEKSSLADPAFRNVFSGQDEVGMFWLLDNNEFNESAMVYEVTSSLDDPGTYPLRWPFYAISVRYVRDVED